MITKKRRGVKPVAKTELSAYMIKGGYTNPSFAKTLIWMGRFPDPVTIARWRAGGKISTMWGLQLQFIHPKLRIVKGRSPALRKR